MTQGAISQSAAGPLTVTNLRAEGSGVNLVDTANIISTFAAKSNSSSINVKSTSGTLTIGAVDGQAGIDSNTIVSVDNTGAGTGIVLAADVKANGGITFSSNSSSMVLAADVTIDSRFDNTGIAGNINLGAFNVSGSGVGRSLTLDASSGSGGTAGTVTLGSFNSSGGNYLNKLIVNIAAPTPGLLTLQGDITLDAKGATAPDAALFEVQGAGKVSIAPAGGSITIETEQANDGYGGKVKFNSNTIYGGSPAKQLFINTGTASAGMNGGDVELPVVSNGTSFSYLDTLDVTALGGSGGTNGIIKLFGNIDTEIGDILLNGPVQLQTSVTLKTNHTASAAGDVWLATNVGDTVSALSSNTNLVVDVSGSSTAAGEFRHGVFGNAASNYVQNLSVNLASPATAGVWRLKSNVTVSGDVTAIGLGKLAVESTGGVTIDTSPTNSGASGAINLGTTSVSGIIATSSLTLNTSTITSGTAGTVTLNGGVQNAAGFYLDNFTVNTSGTSGASPGSIAVTSGAVTVAARTAVSLTGNVTAPGGGTLAISANPEGTNNGTVTLNGAVNSTAAGTGIFTVNAGTGAIVNNATIGGTAPTDTVTLSAGNITTSAITANSVRSRSSALMAAPDFSR